MSPQESATLLLLDHQAERAARMRLAGIRSDQLAEYYASERRKGVAPVVACERMGEHAKFLDREYEADLSVIRSCMERVS